MKIFFFNFISKSLEEGVVEQSEKQRIDNERKILYK